MKAKPLATMRPVPITVPAGKTLPINQVGTFVFVETASAATMTLRATSVVHGTVADSMPVRTAAGYEFPLPYDKLYIHNSSGAEITATLWLGEGKGALNILSGTVTVASGSISITNFAAGSFDSSADVSLATANSHDIAADSTRRELILQAAEANSGELCVRDQSGTTSEGFRLYPGGHKFKASAAAVRVRNNSGATQVLHICEDKS